MSAGMSDAEVLHAALMLLRECPPRSAVSGDVFWRWRRRAETFLAALEEPAVAEVEAERGD